MTTIQIHGNASLAQRLLDKGLAVYPERFRPTQRKNSAVRANTRTYATRKAAIYRAYELNALMESTGGEAYRFIQVFRGQSLVRVDGF